MQIQELLLVSFVDEVHEAEHYRNQSVIFVVSPTKIYMQSKFSERFHHQTYNISDLIEATKTFGLQPKDRKQAEQKTLTQNENKNENEKENEKETDEPNTKNQEISVLQRHINSTFNPFLFIVGMIGSRTSEYAVDGKYTVETLKMAYEDYRIRLLAITYSMVFIFKVTLTVFAFFFDVISVYISSWILNFILGFLTYRIGTTPIFKIFMMFQIPLHFIHFLYPLQTSIMFFFRIILLLCVTFMNE